MTVQSMTLIEQLKQIPDPQKIRGRRHPLWMILFFSLLGFLCGYAEYRPLADFCGQQQSSLRHLLDLPNGQLQAKYPHLASIGVMNRTAICTQQPFCETVYYLSSRSASDLLNATRQHW